MNLNFVKFDIGKEIQLLKQKNPKISDSEIVDILKKKFIIKYNETIEKSFDDMIAFEKNNLCKKIYQEIKNELMENKIYYLPDTFYFYVKENPYTIFSATYITIDNTYEISFYNLNGLESTIYNENKVLEKIKQNEWIIKKEV